MYAGFITPKRVVKRAGIHQRFDSAAYKMIKPYLPAGGFPTLKTILDFEGYNGPDGLNTKVGLVPKGLKPKDHEDHNPSHLYDPVTDTGEVPTHIAHHYAGLVDSLSRHDMIRASFEAAWLAHYVGDGLTPAHHWPLEEKVAEAADKVAEAYRQGDVGRVSGLLQKNWAIWGAKGHMSTHFNFEMGIAFALLLFPIKAELKSEELARARQLGVVEYFKAEARAVTHLNLYERFYKEGWNNSIATTVKNTLAPKTVQAIGVIWLLAVLESGQQLPAGAAAAAATSPTAATTRPAA